jgi:magnesium chelatase subunit ChlD-like protein
LLQHRIRYRSPGRLLLVLLDASGSTLHGSGLQQAKGLIGGLAQSAYRQRWRLAVLSFAGQRVETVFAAGRAPFDAGRLLQRIQGGGGSPLGQGLQAAVRRLDDEHRRHPAEQQTLLLLSDGRYRSGLDIGCLNGLDGHRCERLLIDTEQGAVRLGRARALAQRIGARYLSLTDCATMD